MDESLSNLSRPALQELIDRKTAGDLAAFITRTFGTIVPGEKLHLNWHIRAMAYELEQVLAGFSKRLIITVPPRHLKSIVTSVSFPAFVLGHMPHIKFICASYSSELAIKHTRDFRTVVESDWYQRVFPGTRLSSRKNTETETLTTAGGGRYTTSLDGSLTGYGAHIIILDDIMNPKQAASETLRQKVINWYRGTLLSRLNSKTDDAIIVVMQRLHMDDIVGHLIEEGGWRHLNLPAIAEDDERIKIGDSIFHHRKKGQLLHPEREPAKVLDQMRIAMGSLDFSAQYQQRPTPFEGNVIRRSWLRFYDTLPEVTPLDYHVISWDTAMKVSGNSDWTVGTVWRIQKEIAYLCNVIRGRFDYPTLKRTVIENRPQSSNYSRRFTLIEDKSSGTSLIADLQRDGYPVVPIKPAGDKIERLYSCAAEFEQGAVVFPSKAPWLDELLHELMGFPNTRHDDQVDSISQFLTWHRTRDRPVLAAPIIFSLGPRRFP